MSATENILDAEAEAVLATLPTAAELPSEDGIPMETPWHRAAMNCLIETLQYHWRDRSDFFVGGNMFIYFSLKQVKNRDYRGPDFFVVKDVGPNPERGTWTVWVEDGRYPNVIVELISASTSEIDRVEKKRLYEHTFSTPEYFCFDFEGGRFDAWRLVAGKYEPIEPRQGRYWSEELGLFLGPWEGTILTFDKFWPRFFTAEGELVPTDFERSIAEKQRADAETERADSEKERADLEEKRAIAHKQRAETEKQRADAAELELSRLRTELESLKQSR